MFVSLSSLDTAQGQSRQMLEDGSLSEVPGRANKDWRSQRNRKKPNKSAARSEHWHGIASQEGKVLRLLGRLDVSEGSYEPPLPRLSAMFGMRLWKVTDSLPTWEICSPCRSRLTNLLRTSRRPAMRHKCCSWVESHTTLHRSVQLSVVSWPTQHKAPADYGFVGAGGTVGSQTVLVRQWDWRGPGPVVTGALTGSHSRYVRPSGRHLNVLTVQNLDCQSKYWSMSITLTISSFLREKKKV